MIIGLSDQMSGGLPPPLDLGIVGMPGCNLLAELLASTLLITPTTTATWSLTLPHNRTTRIPSAPSSSTRASCTIFK